MPRENGPNSRIVRLMLSLAAVTAAASFFKNGGSRAQENIVPPEPSPGAYIYGAPGVVQFGTGGLQYIVPDVTGNMHSIPLIQPDSPPPEPPPGSMGGVYPFQYSGVVPFQVPDASPAQAQPTATEAVQTPSVVCQCQCPPCNQAVTPEAVPSQGPEEQQPGT